VTTFSTEEGKVVIHLMLVFLLSQLATQVQLTGQVILRSGSGGLLLISRVMLLLAFVRLLVVLLAGVIVGVVVGQTRIVVIVGVVGGGLVVGPLHFARIVFLSELGFSLPYLALVFWAFCHKSWSVFGLPSPWDTSSLRQFRSLL
jgi:hypothetical protein